MVHVDSVHISVTTTVPLYSAHICHNNSKSRFSSHLCHNKHTSRFNLHLCCNIHTSRFSSQFHNNSTSRFSSHFCHKNGTSSQTEFFLAPATCYDSSTELLQLLIMVKTLLPTMVNKNSPSYSPWSNRTPPPAHLRTLLLTMVK